MKKTNSPGKVIYRSYVGKLEREPKSSFDIFSEEKAADLVTHSPYVTDHLINNGIINRGEHSRLIWVYRGNLGAQLEGAERGTGYLFDTKNAHRRSSAVINHALRNYDSVHRLLKEKSKSDYDLALAFRSFALVESVQTDYIAGTELSEVAETSTGIALCKRFAKDIKDFRLLLFSFGIDTNDRLAVRQFVESGKFRKYATKFWEEDSFFQRRKGVVYDKTATYTDTTDFRKARRKDFTEDLFVHAAVNMGMDIGRLLAKFSQYQNKEEYKSTADQVSFDLY